MYSDQELPGLLREAALCAAAFQFEHGRLPALDDPAMDEALAPIRNRLGPLWAHPGLTGEGTGTSPQEVNPIVVAIPHDVGDPSARAVVCSVIFRLVQGEADEQRASAEEMAIEDDDFPDLSFEIDEWITGALGALRAYLDLRPARETVTRADLLWELHAAGVARHRDRLVEICDLITAGEASTTDLEIATQAIFLEATGVGRELGNAAWVPGWQPSSAPMLELRLVMTALTRVARQLDSLITRGAEPPRSAPECEDGHLLRVAHWSGRISPSERRIETLAICAWANASITGADRTSRVAVAAEQFASLARDSRVPDEFREVALLAEATCHLLTGHLATAAEAIKAANALSAIQPAHFLRLAKVYYLLGADDDLLDAFEAFVLNTPEKTSELFQNSLVLKFGMLARERAQLSAHLTRAAAQASGRAQCWEIAVWSDPHLAKLSKPAQDRWWVGLHTSSLPANRAALGDQIWVQSGLNFAEAVSLEVKHRILKPFLSAHRAICDDMARGGPSHSELSWQAIAKGKATLGQALTFLKDARYPQFPPTAALSTWLKSERPAVAGFLSDPRTGPKLDELAKLRGSAAHDSISEADSRRIFDLARELLRSVVA